MNCWNIGVVTSSNDTGSIEPLYRMIGTGSDAMSSSIPKTAATSRIRRRVGFSQLRFKRGIDIPEG